MIRKTQGLRKKLKKNKPPILLTIFIFCILTQECSLISHKATPRISNNVNYLTNYIRFANTFNILRGSGKVTIESEPQKGSLFTDFTYNNIDSLTIQFKDPIFRKTALLEVKGSKYKLWFQRKDEIHSGSSFPEDYAKYTFGCLSFEELRKILIGVPLFDISEMKSCIPGDTVNSITENGLFTKSVIGDNLHIIKDLLIFSPENKMIGKISYKEYLEVNDFFIPNKILLESFETKFRIIIHISHFSVDLSKLTMR